MRYGMKRPPVREDQPGRIPGDGYPLRRGASCFLLFLFLLGAAALGPAQEKQDALKLLWDGKYEESVRICRQELQTYGREQAGKRMDSYAVMTWALLRLKRYDETIQMCEQGLRESRYDHRLIETLGEAHFYKGNNREALNYFEQYAALLPTGKKIGVVYYFMGEIYLRMGQYHHGDIALSTAVHHSPNIARWWIRLGYVREMAAEYSMAMEAYDQALALKPDSAEAARGRKRVQEKL